MWVLIAAALVISSPGALSLKLISMEVPEKVDPGQDTRLACGYDLEGDVLSAVKWYKDGVEFYRYIPTDQPSDQVFPLNGVDVDLSKSSAGSVYIRSISSSTAGTYECEVSVGAPSFQIVSSKKPMAVRAPGYPPPPPKPPVQTPKPPVQTQNQADRSIASFLLVTMLLIFQCRYHMW